MYNSRDHERSLSTQQLGTPDGPCMAMLLHLGAGPSERGTVWRLSLEEAIWVSAEPGLVATSRWAPLAQLCWVLRPAQL